MERGRDAAGTAMGSRPIAGSGPLLGWPGLIQRTCRTQKCRRHSGVDDAGRDRGQVVAKAPLALEALAERGALELLEDPRRNAATFCPFIRMVPDDGRSMAAINFSIVVLPAPEWPVSTVISPSFTCRFTSASAICPPG